MVGVVEVTKRYGWNPATPDNGYYVIVEDEPVGGVRWAWFEGGERPDFSQQVYGTISEALRGAAKDWDDSGSGGGLTKSLRIAARYYEKAGQ